MVEFLFIFFSGLSLGLLGSLHCVGMCGPLALALPVNHLPAVRKTGSIMLYNLGRALSYAAMGLLFGILGQGFSFFKFQQSLSIFAGTFILAVLLFNHFGNPQTNVVSKLSFQLKAKLSSYIKMDKTLLTFLNIGFLNGLLPCGLVYIAIATAVASGSILKSSLLMFAFGLGTLPIMALTMFSGKFIPLNFRSKLNKATPYIAALVACLLIVRGLSLGIPYLSPTHEAGHVSCCHR